MEEDTQAYNEWPGEGMWSWEIHMLSGHQHLFALKENMALTLPISEFNAGYNFWNSLDCDPGRLHGNHKNPEVKMFLEIPRHDSIYKWKKCNMEGLGKL